MGPPGLRRMGERAAAARRGEGRGSCAVLHDGGLAAVDDELGARDERGVVGGQERVGAAISCGMADAPQGDVLAAVGVDEVRRRCSAAIFSFSAVRMNPGHSALTRMPCSASSTAMVLVSRSTPALEAL